MKRNLLLCFLATACATVHPRPVPDGYEPRPLRLLEPALHAARPPAARLMDVTLGTTMDGIMRNSAPGGVGYVPCSTSTTVATWQTPASCGLATGTNAWSLSTTILSETTGQTVQNANTTDAARAFGFVGYPATATNFLSYLFGNTTNGMQQASAKRVQLFSDHGIMVMGGLSGGTNPPAGVAGGGSADPSLITVSSATGGALRIDASTATAGTAIFYSGRCTVAASAVSCTASTCTSLGTCTATGAKVAAECVTSHTTTAGAIGTNATAIGIECGVTAANTVAIYCCNHTAGALSVTGTYSARVFNSN